MSASGADECDRVVPDGGGRYRRRVDVAPGDDGLARHRLGALDRVVDIVLATVIVSDLERLPGRRKRR